MMTNTGENYRKTDDLESSQSSNMEGDILTEGQSSGYTSVDRDYTTEIFKIEIGNLPKCYSVCHLKKFLIKLKLQPKKVRMVPQRNFAFVTFKCEEDRELALKTLQNYEWRNKILTAKVAKAKEDPFEKKKLQDHTDMKDSNENQDGMQTDAGDMKGIRDVVTPLWNVSYEEQQKMKYDVMSQVLQKMAKELNAANVVPIIA